MDYKKEEKKFFEDVYKQIDREHPAWSLFQKTIAACRELHQRMGGG